MLRNVSRAVAVCDDCGTTASDIDGSILVFFDAGDAFKAVTAEGGPDGIGSWGLLATVGLLCPACHTVRTTHRTGGGAR
jgi:hypothetical protein